jgi:hypothetical protein
MDLQSLLYALVQIAHNFGAVAVVGGSLFGRWPLALPYTQRRRLAWVVLGGWLVQGASGASFGAVSVAYYGQPPDIHGIAVVALLLKIGCAVTGIVLTVLYLRFGVRWSEAGRAVVWNLLIVLSITAVSAAAILRWFS